jgi:hypothetical protein
MSNTVEGLSLDLQNNYMGVCIVDYTTVEQKGVSSGLVTNLQGVNIDKPEETPYRMVVQIVALGPDADKDIFKLHDYLVLMDFPRTIIGVNYDNPKGKIKDKIGIITKSQVVAKVDYKDLYPVNPDKMTV